MNLATYASRNLFRRKGRTAMTILAVALTVLIFSLLRTVLAMWGAGADAAAQDRIATRHKASITLQMPRTYIDQIRAVPGVKAASFAVWFAGKDPKKRVPFFATFGVDQDSWFDVMDDMQVEPDVLAKWKQTRQGAILGDMLAKKLEVKPGDKVTITSDIYEGEWQFEVIGLYKATRRSADRNTFVFRWDYLNDDARAAFAKDQIGWVMSRVAGTGKSADIQQAIDKSFDDKPIRTLTMSERAMQLSFTAGFAVVLDVLNYSSMAILAIMVLILANTIAMGVRERTHEYGVLRAVGFRPGHVLGFVLGESALVALVGGLVGLVLTHLIVNVLMGPALEENMSGVFPYFRAPGSVMMAAVGLAVGLGAVAGALPAWRASRLKVTDALRRID